MAVLLISVAFANAKSVCEEQRDEVLSEDAFGEYIPRCEADGTFTKKQFWASFGKYFCVDPDTGTKTTEYTRDRNLKCE
ncbi:hypothetical protein AVEN_270049-1 [Araneus ventricosus]|uniref:Thyroglobulin type-1 domain-containing protein n=1 Tax=Araneus ventricosus TaxID=182803 RepID=A0A4Y2UN77_ARAVE|nr:hypothetical protein AVEN_270049-1 [Araneus ventricosus]